MRATKESQGSGGPHRSRLNRLERPERPQRMVSLEMPQLLFLFFSALLIYARYGRRNPQ